MSDNIRIRTTPGDNKFLKVNIKQKFDFIEILSLKISQDDAYRRFCSDYGVAVGRVIVNNGVGVPNAKVSIFIPVDEEDKLDPEIFGLYPFETVTDTNSDGIPYNLLPNSSKGKEDCFTTIGTFPTKREIQDNDSLSKIYCKYYKFTTTTNDSGDFMLFGLPVGTHFLHVEADVSDIGFLSQKPYETITQGGSPTNFKSPSKYKNREDSTSLSQLKKFSPINVNVQPFWGDLEQCELGITRADVDLQFSINPSALFMGSIFTDSGKNSVTKQCLPRPNIGKHDQLSTGSGTIEMIRKTRNGEIERFDVNGGEVIDDDGTWNYLIPMNLDYVTTSEEGNLVPTDDPTKGIPTRARVRFRIGIRTNSAQNSTATRAKYLVPNNPESKSETDYNFDQNTKDETFVDLYWNEIYSIKNYIPRVQKTIANPEVREFTGIKDVNSGSSLEFPFNKIDVDINPLFSVICTLLNIFVLIVSLINTLIINLINGVLSIINIVLKALCFVTSAIASFICLIPPAGQTVDECICSKCLQSDRCNDFIGTGGNPCSKACDCDLIPYLEYILLECDGTDYAIGGIKDNSLAWTQTALNQQPPDPNAGIPCLNSFNPPTIINPGFRYPGDGIVPGTDQVDAGWLDCQALLLAETLDVIKFDFNNDWVNGALYSFLFDARGDRFCDIDCSINSTPNTCTPLFINDTCTIAEPINDNASVLPGADIFGSSYTELNVNTFEGLIKSFDDTFYYAPISNTGNKLFTTDIINLGSMVNCNWRGTPRIYQYLINTTFNIPSITAEIIDDVVVETGYDTNFGGTLNQNSSLIADVGCFPIAYVFTDANNCVNIRRLCELGVGLDEQRDGIAPNNRIDNNDVDATYVRGVFAFLNGLSDFEEVKFDKVTSSDFGKDNGDNYEIFRDFQTVNRLGERSSSFYFYFGLNKGKTSYDKILKNFFPECQPELETDFIILGEVTQEDDSTPAPTGEIDIQIINGSAPYDINWTGPGQYTNNVVNYQQDTQTIDNLFVGTYNVTVIDSLNRLSTRSFYVPGPVPVNCSIQTTPLTTAISSDGEIIVSIFNGTAPFDITLVDDNSGQTLGSFLNTFNTSETFPSLPASNYTITVTDALGTTCVRQTEINDLPPLQISLTTSDVSCFGVSNGAAFLSISSGNAPFNIEWKDPSNNIIANGVNSVFNLDVGINYLVTVTDSNGNGNTTAQNFSITQPIDLSYNKTFKNVGCQGSNTGEIRFTSIFSDNQVEISYVNSQGNTVTQLVSNTSGTYNILNLAPGNYDITLKDSVTECEKIESISITEPDTPLAVNLINQFTTGNDARFQASATGGWGDTPAGTPIQGNSYEFTWEVNTGVGGYQQIQNNTTIGGYTFNIFNLTAQGQSSLEATYNVNNGLDVRCRIKGINGNTGAFCERLTQTITI